MANRIAGFGSRAYVWMPNETLPSEPEFHRVSIWHLIGEKNSYLRAIFCKSHMTYDSRVFRMSSYLNQLKIKVILEYGRNFSFIKDFVEFLGGEETTVAFQEMQSVSTS